MAWSKPIRHTRNQPCPVCAGYESLPRGHGVRCAGCTGEFWIWCTREEFAGGAILDLEKSPPAFKHSRFGWCACGQTHGRGLPTPEFTRFLRVVPVREAPTLDELWIRHEVYEHTLSLLNVRDDAAADLTGRGLSGRDIERVGYRSVPVGYAQRKQLLSALLARFGAESLQRVPGYVDKNGHFYFWVKD